jgi:hypothetical protein
MTLCNTPPFVMLGLTLDASPHARSPSFGSVTVELFMELLRAYGSANRSSPVSLIAQHAQI